jgi:hypothetical protein
LIGVAAGLVTGVVFAAGVALGVAFGVGGFGVPLGEGDGFIAGDAPGDGEALGVGEAGAVGDLICTEAAATSCHCPLRRANVSSEIY